MITPFKPGTKVRIIRGSYPIGREAVVNAVVGYDPQPAYNLYGIKTFYYHCELEEIAACVDRVAHRYGSCKCLEDRS